ncbi:MAG: hypothetical protein LBM60_00860 [Clostridium sp.]|jgi:hypothetical protein|nr:hypothetical protein [Clostridium sp.]
MTSYFLYLLPIGMLISILLFFGGLFDHFDRTYYDAVYEQQVLKLNSLLGEIGKLKELGVSEEENINIFIRVLAMSVSKIDSEQGIFARVMDLNFENLSEVIVAEEDRGPVTLFESNANHPDFPRIKTLMEENSRGEANFTDEGYPMRLYFVKVPQDDPAYYIVVGVDAAHVLANFESLPFEIGIFIIALMMMSMLYYILYLRSRVKEKLAEPSVPT